MSTVTAALKPRKSPVQARSAATVGALHTATIQVLTQEGLSRCTTTRVAERAGMSVGSLYQYYPNRDALLAAILEKHLDSVANAIERACHAHRGKPVCEMASALVTAVLAAKLRDPEESKALYAVAGDRGGAALSARGHARIVVAIAAMLASAPDARFDDPATTGTIAFGALIGPVRAWLEGHAEAGFETRLKDHLVRLLTAYLQTHRSRP
ncbi:TetR/AcrR family transcriptional regulator [Rhizobiaceae bacterium BDR2-2]|uniref:TetR/AcrR family transcriptional regulator n=1 Tax=Ectorhizobium quercum TaxID=2965071 RepID=A0AAE3STD4_9HYPH|nr:TetR/AcrR family transcriptional regulator [Ectorhizobium quercum]MCX8995827.1 TetR/AcrR family transcriptional regulator [Ectorhizobium quercum]